MFAFIFVRGLLYVFKCSHFSSFLMITCKIIWEAVFIVRKFLNGMGIISSLRFEIFKKWDQLSLTLLWEEIRLLLVYVTYEMAIIESFLLSASRNNLFYLFCEPERKAICISKGDTLKNNTQNKKIFRYLSQFILSLSCI